MKRTEFGRVNRLSEGSPGKLYRVGGPQLGHECGWVIGKRGGVVAYIGLEWSGKGQEPVRETRSETFFLL